MFRRLKAAGLTISLDTNDDPQDIWGGGVKDLLKYVDVLLPNEREATRITGTDDPETAIQQLAELVPLVVVKLGNEGALAQRGKERFTSPSLKVKAVDAVGAGDSFDAGFLHEYLARLRSPNLPGQRQSRRRSFRDPAGRNRSLPRQEISREIFARALMRMSSAGVPPAR